MRPKVVAALVAIVLAATVASLVLFLRRAPGAGGPDGTGSNAAPKATAEVLATPTPTSPAPASPSPSPSAATPSSACTAGQLAMAVGAASAVSGGGYRVTLLLADHSGTTCQVVGPVSLSVVETGGLPPTTATAAGRAWLSAHRMPLDPWEPQPGEATLQLSWTTERGDAGPCAEPQTVTGVTLATGGGAIAATVGALPAFPGGVPGCVATLTAGRVTPVSSVAAFTGNAAQAGDAEVEIQEYVTVSGTCAGSARCATRGRATLGTDAAFFEYALSGAAGGVQCFAYTYRAGAAWHPFDVICGAASAPADGSAVSLSEPGGGCVRVHSAPGHSKPVLACVTPSSQTTYTVAGAPVYISETDSVSGVSSGTLWWYLTGLNGWVAQDWIAS